MQQWSIRSVDTPDIQRMEEENAGLQQQRNSFPDQDYLRVNVLTPCHAETNIAGNWVPFSTNSPSWSTNTRKWQRVEDNAMPIPTST
jgi:hypothetical protein